MSMQPPRSTNFSTHTVSSAASNNPGLHPRPPDLSSQKTTEPSASTFVIARAPPPLLVGLRHDALTLATSLEATLQVYTVRWHQSQLSAPTHRVISSG